jgi:hypothetical protein
VFLVRQAGHEPLASVPGTIVFATRLDTSVLDQSRSPFGAGPRTRTIALELVQLPNPGTVTRLGLDRSKGADHE